MASKAWAEEWATNRQYPFVNMSVALKALYPPFAADQTTPWPSTDGKRPMPVLAASAAAEGGNGAANPWNPPTSITLKPGETISIGLRLQLASGGPRTRDETLTAMGAPVLHARVHARLARFAIDGGGGGGDGFTRDEAAALRKASALVDTLRREAAGGGRQLSLATLFARFFSARPDAEAAIAAARYLQQAKRPQLLTHALACGGGGSL